jgi:hypothetical protein
MAGSGELYRRTDGKWAFRIAVLVMLFASTSIAACSDSDPAEELYGVWLTPLESLYLEFDEDGSWSGAETLGSQPFDWGTFDFDGGTLTFIADPASSDCTVDGSYEVTFITDDELSLSVIDDPCGPRAIDLSAGPLMRHSA